MNTLATVFGVLCTVWYLPSSAKQEPEDFKLTTNAELVLLDVGVKDPKGGYVSDLRQDDFKVYDNSRLQRITHFSSEDLPVTIGLALDNSGSMRMKRREVVTAALAFIGASNRNDEMFVVNFNDSVTRGLPDNIPFTDDSKHLRKALWAPPAAGRTALYDAVLESLHHLTFGTRSKKALILVSDGGDNASEHALRDVIAKVRESPATIYTIGIFDETDPDRNPDLLRQLARISGGEAFFPKELSEVSGICQQIAEEIRHRYTIGYVPSRVGEKESLRTIKVSVAVAGSQKFVVHARTKYVLPERHDAGSSQ